MKRNFNFQYLCLLLCLLLLDCVLFASIKEKNNIKESLKKAVSTNNILGKKNHIEAALYLLYENTDSLKSLLQSSDTSDINFALNVYAKVIEINNTIFANSEPASHLDIYNFEQETYHKNLHLLYHAYRLTKHEEYAKTALVITEKYKSIELWKKDTLKATFNVLYEKDLEQIQEKMAAKQALISYHYGISNKKIDSCYAFVCTKDRVSFQSIHVDATTINAYVKELQQPLSESKAYKKYAYKLYQDLFAILPIDTTTTKELTIFAEGKLATIPFEALLTSEYAQKDFLKMPYLLKQYTIHYDLSLPLWNEQKKGTAKQNMVDNFLIMSPSFSKLQLDDLPHNVAVAESLHQNYAHTHFFQKEEAIIANFQSYAPQANIIHLASHAFLSSDSISEPSIAFSGSYLRASQISNMKLSNCHLAVLACCETGNGNYEKGIGIKSLNYSFRKNDVKSVIASLWRVDDEKTSRLLQDFYRFLSQGHNKSSALQKAKLKYLETAMDYDTPYYWAGLVLNGQKDAVVLKQHKCSKQQIAFGYYLLIIAVFVFVILCYMIGFIAKTK